MPSKSKKSSNKQSSSNKVTSSSRTDNITSALQKQRHVRKARKSIKIIASQDSQIPTALQQQQQMMKSDQEKINPLTDKRSSRVQTLSPDKNNYHMYKLDPNHVLQYASKITEQPVQQQSYENSNNKVYLLQNDVSSPTHHYQSGNNQSLKQNEQSQNISQAFVHQLKGRPLTSEDSKEMLQAITKQNNENTATSGLVIGYQNIAHNIVNQASRSLIPLSTSQMKKGLQSSTVATGTNQGSIVQLGSPELKQVYGSPSRQIPIKQQNSQSSTFAGLLSSATQQLESLNASNINAINQKIQQQQSLRQNQQAISTQFQHILKDQNILLKQDEYYQNNVQGLLNMTKQRGLISNPHNNLQQAQNNLVQQQQQLVNLRGNLNPNVQQQIQQQQQYQLQQQQLQQQQSRSQSNQKQNLVAAQNTHIIGSQNLQGSQLQNNGKMIVAKSPLYNSLQPTQNQNLGQHQLVGSSQYQQYANSFANTYQQQAFPLAILDMQFYHSKFLSDYNFILDLGEPLVQPKQLINKNGYQYVNQRQNNKAQAQNTIVPLMNQQYVQYQQKRPFVVQNSGYYYYDQPVAINGKQLGVNNSATIQQVRQDKNGKIQKTGSETQFFMSQYDLQFYEQLQNFNHEEQIKNTILQELLENQALPSQLIQLVEKKKSEINPIGGLSKNQQKQKSKIPFSNAYVEDCYKFIVVPGNNSGLVRKAIERRDWWIEIPALHSMFNFKWQPVSNGIKFERLSPVRPKIGEIGAIGQNQYNQTFTSSIGGSSTTASTYGGNNNQTENVQLRQMVNHFEGHHFISEKSNLFNMLQKHCDGMKENIFDVCPITFYVEVPDVDKMTQYNQAMSPFIQFYQCLEENRERAMQIKQQIIDNKAKQIEQLQQLQQQQQEDSNNEDGGKVQKDITQIINNKNKGEYNKLNKFKTFNFEKRTSTKYTFPMSHFDGFNLWLLKPTHLNRGRGIHVFRDLETFHKLIREYCQGRDEEQKTVKKDKDKEKDPMNPNKDDGDEKDLNEDIDQAADSIDKPIGKQKTNSPKKNSNVYKIKHNTFIIQKYIERPLLLCNRKFDIRVWVLVNQDFDLFFFKEGYLRTSSSEFSIDLQNIDNQFVHLTNNAVQKYSEKYGDFEDGNQLGYKRFQELIDQQDPQSGFNYKEHLIPQMKELIIRSMHSARKKLDPFKRKHCFELFGYDFILDEDYNVWLIEVNTNPCIEESSELLKIYLPRMIEDMLRLTIDHMFPKNKWRKKKTSQPTTNSNGIGGIQTPLKSSSKAASGQNGQPQVSLQPIEEDARDNNENLSTLDPNIVLAANGADQDKQKSSMNSSFTKEEKKRQRIHQVEGYPDNENMWEKIWNLDRVEAPFTKYPNCRSEFNFQVTQSKHFKIKKNPLYKQVLKEMISQDNQNQAQVDTQINTQRIDSNKT